jgi:hypothetical protein
MAHSAKLRAAAERHALAFGDIDMGLERAVRGMFRRNGLELTLTTDTLEHHALPPCTMRQSLSLSSS